MCGGPLLGRRHPAGDPPTGMRLGVGSGIYISADEGKKGGWVHSECLSITAQCYIHSFPVCVCVSLVTPHCI